MKIKQIIIMIILGLIAACSKNDPIPTPVPDPIQQPDPKPEPEPENRPPGSFVLLAPETDAEITSRTPTFSWEQATDPDGDVVSYDLYLDIEENPSELLVENLATSHYELNETLEFDKQYFWKVIATDGNGAETVSDIGSFIIDLPIAYLRKFTQTLTAGGKMPEKTQTFNYANEILIEFEDSFGMNWSTNYNSSSGDLTSLNHEVNGEFVSYVYEYTSFGKQKSIQLLRSARIESWQLDYDGQQRLKSVLFEEKDNNFERTDMITFDYADVDSTQPDKIVLVRTGSDHPDPFTLTINLEWQGRNIIAMIFEGKDEGILFSGREEYEYDDNINPYYMLVKNQFGLDDFYILHRATGMETFNFGPFSWQSFNNLIKMERFNSVNAAQPSEIITYEYGYTDSYYPHAATVQTTRNGNSNTEELNWSY